MTSLGASSETDPLGKEDTCQLGFSIFGVPLEIVVPRGPIQSHFEVVYHHFRRTDEPTVDTRPVQFAMFPRNDDGPLEIVVKNYPWGNLSDVFRRGSNRHRFTVVTEKTEDRIFDRFLGGNCVMSISGNSCRVLDPRRAAAYAESVVFHTILSHIPDHYLLHAGVVSWQDRAVILCGSANSGKTTLTLGSVRSGFRFLTDEVALINQPSALVLPFPRALGIRLGTLRMFPEMHGRVQMHPTLALSGDEKSLVDMEEIYPGSIGRACQPSVLVFLEGLTETSHVDQLPKSEAVFKCLEFAHTAEGDVFKSMMLTSSILEGLECYRMTQGPVDEAVRVLTELIEN